MKIAWKKVLLVAADTMLMAYTVVAVTAFNKPDTSSDVCTKVNIGIDDNSSNAFIDAPEIKRRLEATGLDPMGKSMDKINPRKIEELLKGGAFVNTAECYKTIDGQVFIGITQRLPVIRIKAENGDDYYVDDKNSIMPKSDYTSDLIIATGSIDRTFATNYISPLGKVFMQNELWKNLIEQIHVLPDKGIELVPRIGDHIVYIGQLPSMGKREAREKAINDYVETKMTRLLKFYRYGLTTAGWNKYDYINMEFDNQIICRRHDAAHPQAATAAPAEPAQAKPDSLSAAKPAKTEPAADKKPATAETKEKKKNT